MFTYNDLIGNTFEKRDTVQPNVIDGFIKFKENKFIFNSLYKLLNDNNLHIHGKKSPKLREGMYMEKDYSGFIWCEGEPNTKFIERKMLREFSKYPIAGDYEVDPKIFIPEIVDLIKFSMEDED